MHSRKTHKLPKIKDFCNYENRRFSVIEGLLEYLALFMENEAI
jgi:hypothetical protein